MRITVKYSNGTENSFKSFDDITDNDNVIELKERGYSSDMIEKWVSYIE